MEKYDSTKFITERVCREERQYALFLYLLFYKNIGKVDINENINRIINACIFGEDNNEQKVVIEAAYYEATFMRDYFLDDRIKILSQFDKKSGEWSQYAINKLIKEVIKRDDFKEKFKSSFNCRLLEYCKLNKDNGLDKVLEVLLNKGYLLHNLGNKEIKGVFEKEKSLKNVAPSLIDARKMMCSKPDIAIVYRNLEGQQKYLRLFECKYLSNESDSQRGTQDKIANFLCKEVFTDNTEVDEAHKLNKDKEDRNNNIIRFVKDGDLNVDKNKEEVNIPIDLIMQLIV